MDALGLLSLGLIFGFSFAYLLNDCLHVLTQHLCGRNIQFLTRSHESVPKLLLNPYSHSSVFHTAPVSPMCIHFTIKKSCNHHKNVREQSRTVNIADVGVKNHHLKSISTPLQFFTQLIFWVLQSFFSTSSPFYKPYKQRKIQLSYQTQPKAIKPLAGLLTCRLQVSFLNVAF
jgi:hypothetical protein